MQGGIMPDRSRQKERKRLKRKRKHEAHRRAAAGSPFKLISRIQATVQCWINTNWEHTRQASILVLRQTASGRCAMANFLVDFGMAGLKDAFGRLDVTAADFFDNVLEPFQNQFPMALIEPSEALRHIAGGIRFAHDNGFRLPHRYDRWLAIVGDVGDWRTADVSDFEMEFAGSMEDLRHRLIGQSVEEFLMREDVSIVLSDSAPSLLSDDILDCEEADDELRQRAVSSVRQWLLASGQPPSALLDCGWDIYAEAVATSVGDIDNGEESLVEGAQQIADTLNDLIALEPSQERAELQSAVGQILAYVAENQNAVTQLLGGEAD
jgi:hypothetical protein